MRVIGYLVRPFVVFVFGAASFFLLLLAIACIGLLLSVGLTCALFTAWALVHLAVYLTLHDRSAGHAAVQAILIAAACFGFIVLTFRTTADLFGFARRQCRDHCGTTRQHSESGSLPVGRRPVVKSCEHMS